MKTSEIAKGRWVEILTALGHENALITKHVPCPVCGGEDRYRYIDDDDGGFFCGSVRGDGIGLIKHLRGCSDSEAYQLAESVIGKPDFKPVERTKTVSEVLAMRAIKVPRSAYLESRGLEMPKNLFFAKAVKYYVDGEAVGTYDAMLAPFTKDDRFITFQATYLFKGKKAPIKDYRKTLPCNSPLSGGAVQLYDAGKVLGVAEGVETAIACHMMDGIPVWATLSASLMRGFDPPKDVEKVIIYGDNDQNLTGQASAYHLANRLLMKGIDVEIKIPDKVGWDWCDVLENINGLSNNACDTIVLPETLSSVIDWAIEHRNDDE